MRQTNSSPWDYILQGLPTYTTNDQELPLPEVLKTIRFCLKAELYDTVLTLLDVVSSLRKDVDFLNWKAMVEYEAKQYTRSYLTYEEILRYVKSTHTLFNAGRAAYKANQLVKSEEYLKQAVELSPLDSSIALEYAVTIGAQGYFDQALELIESIQQDTLTDLHKKNIIFNKGWHYIRLGDFRKGVEHLYLARSIIPWGSDKRSYTRPKWTGVTLPGKTILIVGEGGIGDEVINARFSQTIKSRGMNAIMSTTHGNTSMLSSIKTLDRVIDSKDIDSASWDFWAPAMDLPYLLNISDSDIPSTPYLHVNPNYLSKWKSIINSPKFNIGIRWSGNPRYELDLARTLDITLFEEYLDLDGIQLYSLQTDDKKPQSKLPKNCIDISNELVTWDDTMAAISTLDLVITSCTSIAHVSGALGKPTWVVIPLFPYYTWADMKSTSCWYDSVRLFRQKIHQDWHHPFKELRSQLKSVDKYIDHNFKDREW